MAHDHEVAEVPVFATRHDYLAARIAVTDVGAPGAVIDQAASDLYYPAAAAAVFILADEIPAPGRQRAEVHIHHPASAAGAQGEVVPDRDRTGGIDVHGAGAHLISSDAEATYIEPITDRHRTASQAKAGQHTTRGRGVRHADSARALITTNLQLTGHAVTAIRNLQGTHGTCIHANKGVLRGSHCAAAHVESAITPGLTDKRRTASGSVERAGIHLHHPGGPGVDPHRKVAVHRHGARRVDVERACAARLAHVNAPETHRPGAGAEAGQRTAGSRGVGVVISASAALTDKHPIIAAGRNRPPRLIDPPGIACIASDENIVLGRGGSYGDRCDIRGNRVDDRIRAGGKPGAPVGWVIPICAGAADPSAIGENRQRRDREERGDAAGEDERGRAFVEREGYFH